MMLILQSRQITVFILLTEESSRIKEEKQYEVPIDISQYPAQQEKSGSGNYKYLFFCYAYLFLDQCIYIISGYAAAKCVSDKWRIQYYFT